jgi:hypothetical protein
MVQMSGAWLDVGRISNPACGWAGLEIRPTLEAFLQRAIVKTNPRGKSFRAVQLGGFNFSAAQLGT